MASIIAFPGAWGVSGGVFILGGPPSGPPSLHAPTHQSGGADEINVAGLSGLLADGQTPIAHGSSHNPGAADPITTAAPVSIGTANATGGASSVANSAHVHDHGAQTVETQHAVVSASAKGFFPRSNLTATDDPDQSDDTTDGFESGSMFVNESWVGGAVFTCTDPAEDAAEWQINAKPQILGVPLEGLLFAMSGGDVHSYPGSGTSVRNIAPGMPTTQLGVISGGTTFVDGGFLFDGDSGFIQFDNEDILDNVFAGIGTVSSWQNVLSDGEGNDGRLIVKGGAGGGTGWFTACAGAGGIGAFPDIRLTVNRATTDAVFEVALEGEFAAYGTTFHSSWTYDSDNPDTPATCRINGVPRAVTVVAAGSGAYVSDAPSPLRVGNRGNGDFTLDGTVYEVTFHNRALTDAEGATMFSAGAPLLVAAQTAAPYITGVPPVNLEFLVCAVQIDSYPGGGTAVRNIAPAADGEADGVFNGNTVYSESAFLIDGASGNIEFASYPGMEDIFAGEGCITVWFKALSDGEGNSGRILSTESIGATTGWSLRVGSEDMAAGTMDLVLTIRTDATGGNYIFADVVVTGEWTCATVKYNTSALATPPVAVVNGVPVPLDPASTTATGTYGAEAEEPLFLGNRAGDAQTFDGFIGFVAMHSAGLADDEVEREFSSTAPLFGVLTAGGFRKTFSNAAASTAGLGLASIYAQVGTMSAPRTLTLSNATRDLATTAAPVSFTVFDESGSADGTNKIILDPESGNINGASTVEITAGFGNFEVYTFGGDWFAR